MDRLILFSGGMDSTVSLMVTLHSLKHRDKPGSKVHALTFDYGQRHVAECEAARDIWRFLSRTPYEHYLGKHVTMPIPKELLPATGSLLGGEAIKTENTDELDNSFIPHRNLLFFTLGAMWAREWKCRYLITGLRGGFPDCTAAFESAVQDALLKSDPDWTVELITYVRMSRAETVKRAATIDHGLAALGFSLTCFQGTAVPCGRCLPCRERAHGFAEAGIDDPLITNRVNL